MANLIEVTYQDYCADNLISWAKVPSDVAQKYRTHGEYPHLLDLRRKYSSIATLGIVYELYFIEIEKIEPPQVESYKNSKDVQLFNCDIDGKVKATRCFEECTAKWLAYILLARIKGLRYRHIKTKVLGLGVG